MSSKKKLIAVAEIHRTVKPGVPGDKSKGISPVPPKVQIISPKTVFTESDEPDREDGSSKASRLLDSGSARLPYKDEKVEVALKDVKATDDGDEGSAPAKPVSKMTVEELDAHMEANHAEPPEGWAEMNAKDKKAWLTANADKPEGDDGSDLV